MKAFATALHGRVEPLTQDPLGFVPTINELAGYFSPALTATTDSARYFTVLCAGMELGAAKQAPKDAVLRFERIWAFAAGAAGDLGGVRGQRSVTDQLQVTGTKKTVPVDYPFFREGSQARQGVWGIYAASAERLGLHHRGRCTDRGVDLADCLVENARQRGLESPVWPGATKRFSREAAEMLGGWFGPSQGLDKTEAAALAEGLEGDPRQHRLSRWLSSWSLDSDLGLLHRLATTATKAQAEHRLVAEAAVAVETLYRHASRVLDALWQGAKDDQTLPVALAPSEVTAAAKVVPEAAAAAWARLANLQPLGLAFPSDFTETLTRLQQTAPNAEPVADALLGRHTDVHADKGAAPWLVRRGGRLDLGAPRAELTYKPPDPHGAVMPHVFRLSSLQRIARAVRAAGVTW